MKKSVILALAALFLISCFVGCTEQMQIRSFGGDGTVKLPAGKKLINATWKESNLWVLTRPMRTDEQPETFLFQESSSFGIMEGSITFIETR